MAKIETKVIDTRKVTKEEQERLEIENERAEQERENAGFEDHVTRYDSPPLEGKALADAREEKRVARQKEVEAQVPELSPEHKDFNKLVDGLYNRVADMQLRPDDTKKFSDVCEKIKEAYAAK